MKWEDLKHKREGGGDKTPPFSNKTKLMGIPPPDNNAANNGYAFFGSQLTGDNANDGNGEELWEKNGIIYSNWMNQTRYTGWALPNGITSQPVQIIDGINMGPGHKADTPTPSGSTNETTSAIWGTGLNGSPTIYAPETNSTTDLYTGDITTNYYTGLALKGSDTNTIYCVINGTVQNDTYTVNNLEDLSKQLATDESNMESAIASAKATAQAGEKSAQQAVTADGLVIQQLVQDVKDEGEVAKAEATENTKLTTENKTLNQELTTANQTITTDKTTIANDEAALKSANETIAKDKEVMLANEKTLVNMTQAINQANQDINSLNKSNKQLTAQNEALSQTLSGSPGHEAIAPGNTQTNPVPLMNTILSVAEFQKFTTNYYLSQTGTNGYFANSTLKRMQSIISNVELNLNAMLNGRLYEKYPPGAVVFRGYGNLTPEVEEQTLYQCLTECVEYRLITQQYVNLNNSYSGMVNGNNNYQTQNNNVIGLRQDIQAKLSLLGLYANVLLGKKIPKSTEYQNEHDGHLTINFSNLQQWYGFIQNTAWNFTKPISFQNGMTFAGNVLFTADTTFTGNISTKGSITSSGLNVNGSLNALGCDLTNGNLSNVSLGSFQNINVSNASDLHNVNLTGTPTMPSTVSSSNTNWKLAGENNTFNCSIPSTFQDLTVSGKLNFNSTTPTAFQSSINITQGNLNLDGKNQQINASNGSFTIGTDPNSAPSNIGTLISNNTITAKNLQYYTTNWGYNNDGYVSSLKDVATSISNLPMSNGWITNCTHSDLLNSVNNPHITFLGCPSDGCFLMEQYAVEVYDLTSPELVPGYMSPIADGQSYFNLQKLFLNTFGNGDLTNGYSYTFHFSLSDIPPLNFAPKSSNGNFPGFNSTVLDTNFTVYITTDNSEYAYGEVNNNYYYAGYRGILNYYSGNPFPNGVVGTNQLKTTSSQPTSYSINLTVPYAVDNRQADDSMFLHGALPVNLTNGQYAICVFKIRYLVNVGGFGTAPNSTPTKTNASIIPEIVKLNDVPGANQQLGRPIWDMMYGGLVGYKQQIDNKQITLTTTQLQEFMNIVNTYNNLVNSNNYTSDEWGTLYQQWIHWGRALNPQDYN